MYGGISTHFSYILAVEILNITQSCTGIAITSFMAMTAQSCIVDPTTMDFYSEEKIQLCPSEDTCQTASKKYLHPNSKKHNAVMCIIKTESTLPNYIDLLGGPVGPKCQIQTFGKTPSGKIKKQSLMLDPVSFCNTNDKTCSCVRLGKKAHLCSSDIGGGIICNNYLTGILVETRPKKECDSPISEQMDGLFSKLTGSKTWIQVTALVHVRGGAESIKTRSRILWCFIYSILYVGISFLRC